VLRFIVWILLLAAVVYALFWIMDRRTRGGSGRGGGFGGGSRPVRPPAPKGPDDDEDFLRDLDWQRRRNARRKPSGDQPATDPDPDPASDEHDQSGADDSAEPPHK
jgi:hypothetical protein